MTQLLVIREYIKNFYTKYEEFIVPLLKFVLGLILFLTINGRMGYMAKIDHVAIALVAANFAFIYPILTADILTRAEWMWRMWLGNAWI